MQKRHLIFPALLLLSMTAACTPSRPSLPLQSQPDVQTQNFDARQYPTLGTALELRDEALRLARHWRRDAQFVMLDGYWITEEGRNDFTLEGVWAYAFVAPQKKDLGLRVSFTSRSNEPVIQEVSRQQITASKPIGSEWQIDSDLAMKLALAHGIAYYPVDQVRLSHTNHYKRLTWQVVSHGDYAAFDGETGEPLTPPLPGQRAKGKFTN